MHASTIFATIILAIGASAAPSLPINGLGQGVGTSQTGPIFPANDQTTVQQAVATCGKDMTLQCCNDVDITTSAKGQAAQLLGLDLNNVLGDLGIFGKCNDISLNVINLVPINNLLNNKCKQNVACCQQNNSPTTQNGLVNAGLPCIALSNLLA